MAKIKRSEWRLIKNAFEENPGYILDFSNNDFLEFFRDEFNVEIYTEDYSKYGDSKGKRFRAYLEISSPRQVGRVLRELWSYKQNPRDQDFRRRSQFSYLNSNLEALDIEMSFASIEDEEFEYLIQGIESRDQSDILDAAEVLASEFNLDTVMLNIQRARDFLDDDPEDSITAACSLLESLCKSILVSLDEEMPSKKTIKPLYTKTANILDLSSGRSDIDSEIIDDVKRILTGLASTVDGIGALRTHGGDAHGQDRGATRIDRRIARLSVNASSAAAIFLIETWEKKFPGKVLHKNLEDSKK